MDTADAVGDPVNMIEAIRIDDDDDRDGDENDDFEDYDDDDDEKPEIGLVFEPENQWSLCRQYFPSKAGGIPVLYILIKFFCTLLLSCFIQCGVNNRLGLTL